MKINVTEDGTIRLSELFNEIEIHVQSDHFITIAERDGTLEISCGDQLYTIDKGEIKKIVTDCIDLDTVPSRMPPG